MLTALSVKKNWRRKFLSWQCWTTRQQIHSVTDAADKLCAARLSHVVRAVLACGRGNGVRRVQYTARVRVSIDGEREGSRLHGCLCRKAASLTHTLENRPLAPHRRTPLSRRRVPLLAPLYISTHGRSVRRLDATSTGQKGTVGAVSTDGDRHRARL